MPPAIILKTQFSTSKFKGYLKYINDEKSNKANHDKKENSKFESRHREY